MDEKSNWSGDVLIADGIGIFRGHIGDNRIHRHWAGQITISLEDTFDVEVPGMDNQSLQAAFFRPNVEHRLVTGKVCSFYFDPASQLFDYLVESSSGTNENWGPLVLTSRLKMLVQAKNPLDVILTELCPNQTIDSRLRSVLAHINFALNQKNYANRSLLAELAGMSPSRFSHWFVEQLGIPVRSYKKWLKLRLAINSMLEGQSAINAALTGGFSDQAHMCREFTQAFGITYMSAQAAITSHKEQ